MIAFLLILVMGGNPDGLEASASAFLYGLTHLRRLGIHENSSSISGRRSATDNISQSDEDGQAGLKLHLDEIDTCLSVCRSNMKPVTFSSS